MSMNSVIIFVIVMNIRASEVWESMGNTCTLPLPSWPSCCMLHKEDKCFFRVIHFEFCHLSLFMEVVT